MTTTKAIGLVAREVRFYSHHDEEAFFSWLDRIDGVSRYYGQGTEIVIELMDEYLSDLTLREILALFFRYGCEMAQLARFETNENRPWFCEPSSYWYHKVFLPS